MSLEKDIPQELKSKILWKLRDELVAAGHVVRVTFTRPEGWHAKNLLVNLLVSRWMISVFGNNFHLFNTCYIYQKVVGIDENSIKKIISILGTIE